MDDRTCLVSDCNGTVYCRGVCAKHYGIAYRRGAMGELSALAPAHRLSDVDVASKTATCAICGPIIFRFRVDHGRMRATCVGAKRSVSASSTRAFRHRLRSKYGLTITDYENMVSAQRGLCAICETAAPLVVDHNHDTGAVRALLCGACNTGIGHLGDSPARLLSAVLYLSAFTSQSA